MEGILNTLKPSGMTSHDVVAYLRKKLHGIKIGHTGTLDPAASGVLPLCLGRATRISSYLLEGKKSYRGEVTFGISTDTLDSLGEITSRSPAEKVTPELIKEVFLKNTGETEQVPPLYSAVHYRGKRSYELARRGENVTLPSRKVKIFALTLVDYSGGALPRVIFDVECSHGTYIRSLAKKTGEDLGTDAHLSFLLRTSVGPFTLDTAETLEEIDERVNTNTLKDIVMPMDYALQHTGKVSVNEEALPFLAQGNYLYENQVVDKETAAKGSGFLRIYDVDGNFWGIGQWENTQKGIMFKPVKIFRRKREGNS